MIYMSGGKDINANEKKRSVFNVIDRNSCAIPKKTHCRMSSVQLHIKAVHVARPFKKSIECVQEKHGMCSMLLAKILVP